MQIHANEDDSFDLIASSTLSEHSYPLLPFSIDSSTFSYSLFYQFLKKKKKKKNRDARKSPYRLAHIIDS